MDRSPRGEETVPCEEIVRPRVRSGSGVRHSDIVGKLAAGDLAREAAPPEWVGTVRIP
jgi:hypothetical protein